jgi:hypothetical protein
MTATIAKARTHPNPGEEKLTVKIMTRAGPRQCPAVSYMGLLIPNCAMCPFNDASLSGPKYPGGVCELGGRIPRYAGGRSDE